MMLIYISILLAGCVKTKASDKSLSFSFDKNEYYTGFSDLPSKLTLEKVKEDGYYYLFIYLIPLRKMNKRSNIHIYLH